ncbi:MAG TPA: VOC family protein [Actinomycetes bacterium]|nr:VOC family protein [Actinomycetes bacterium]
MSKLSTWLWFDGNGEEAAQFYARLFGGEVTDIQRYPKDGMYPEGSVMTASFRIFDQELHALNGGPDFKHSPATSFMVQCPDQDEIDRVWAALSEGGEELPCGWVTDRFNITWQVVPEQLDDLLSGGGDPEARTRVWDALMSMVKIDLKTLQDAYRSP